MLLRRRVRAGRGDGPRPGRAADRRAPRPRHRRAHPRRPVGDVAVARQPAAERHPPRGDARRARPGGPAGDPDDRDRASHLGPGGTPSVGRRRPPAGEPRSPGRLRARRAGRDRRRPRGRSAGGSRRRRSPMGAAGRPRGGDLAPRDPNVTMARRSPAAPEDSIGMRVVVALAVEVGIIALAVQGAVTGAVALTALVLAPAGYAFSYVRRARPSIVLKVLLALGLVVATMAFLQTVRSVTTVDAARIPLSGLFLWVQVLHAFDVPRRRDLAFSMTSSTTLIAAAGALALTTSFVWVLGAWAALAAAWLWLSSAPRPEQRAAPLAIRTTATGPRPRLASVRSAAVAGIAALCLGSALFLVMPRLPASLLRTPPFGLGHRTPTPSSTDSVSNPGLPSAGGDGVVDFAALGYPGFSSAMDLRARGALSDQIVFRVRADQPDLWRAEVFDTYDGSVWTALQRDRADLLRVPGAAERLVRRGAGGEDLLPEQRSADGPVRLDPLVLPAGRGDGVLGRVAGARRADAPAATLASPEHRRAVARPVPAAPLGTAATRPQPRGTDRRRRRQRGGGGRPRPGLDPAAHRLRPLGAA
ncbi:MAG: DUF3488 domain-containing protein [Actinobacteria bacterium]|nr:MAG: DUF3488 domain-containing protein [Actinomycetota bacterium]